MVAAPRKKCCRERGPLHKRLEKLIDSVSQPSCRLTCKRWQHEVRQRMIEIIFSRQYHLRHCKSYKNLDSSQHEAESPCVLVVTVELLLRVNILISFTKAILQIWHSRHRERLYSTNHELTWWKFQVECLWCMLTQRNKDSCSLSPSKQWHLQPWKSGIQAERLWAIAVLLGWGPTPCKRASSSTHSSICHASNVISWSHRHIVQTGTL